MWYRGAREYERLTPRDGNRRWSAFDAQTEDQSLVELRLLEPADETDVARFLRRLQLVRVVHHAGIRRILDIAVDHQPQFFVLEPVQGPTLAEQQALAPLSLEQTLQLGRRLAEALSEAHRCGIVAGNLNARTVIDRGSQDWVIDLTCEADEQATRDTEETEQDNFALCRLLQSLCPPDKPGVPGTLAGESHQARVDLISLLESGTQDGGSRRPTALEIAKRLAAIFDAFKLRTNSTLAQTMVKPSSDVELIEKTIVGVDRMSDDSEPVVPEALGRFQLHESLGKGAFGAVYRATDLSNGETVAIKVLNSQLARTPLVVRRFTKEARLLAKAGNPFVASLIDANSDQDFHFLAIEFVAGGTLSALIRGGQRLSESVALRLMLDAARGLAVAHQQSIIHRDVKPDNILLTTTGVDFARSTTSLGNTLMDSNAPLVKLSDFGLARTDQQSESLAITHSGAIMGTPLYMAPEQCRGLPADARSDVYSLGATLFHILAGRPPFQGDNHIAVMNAHCSDPLPSLSRLCPEVSDGCVTVVEKCLARNPDARYADALALQADLERLLHGESTSMQLHPASPATAGLDVVEFLFSCELAASPGQLWPYVANTDRVNFAMGLSAVSYTTRNDPVRGVERIAETRMAGQRIVWQEHPYEWIEGRRLSVLREFSTGPFLWFMNIVQMEPVSGGGTRLTQTFKVVPRNWLGRQLAKLQLGRRVPKSFRKVYAQIDSYLQQSGSAASTDPWGSNVAMTAAGRGRLEERLLRLNDQHVEPRVIETLRQFLEHASDLEVARIRPLIFAERFQLNSKDVIEACLLSAKEGLLVLLWDILCPSCRIPADVQETLASLKDHAYCPACDLRYEIDFANSVELIFRAHPEVRVAETKIYCIGGPTFSAHVVAQTRLAPGERFEMELMLNEGSYRLRGSQLPFAVDLRVSAGTGVTRAEIPLLRPPLPNSVPVLRQGTQVLSLFNNTPRELQIRLERTAGRQMALTAAAAAAIPMFREMFPAEVLAPGQIVSVTNVTLLMAEICDANRLYQELGDGPAFGKIRRGLMQMEEAVRAAGGAVIKIAGEGIVATFGNSLSALRAAVAMQKADTANLLPRRIAVHRGSAMVTTINDRLDYFGETVYLTRTMLQAAAAGELLATARTLQQDDILLLLNEEGLTQKIAEFTLNDSATILCRILKV